MSFIVIIPARYASSRLPGKPLVDIAGKPMIQRVCECAKASAADRVIVATDDERIEQAVIGFGGEVCMTKAEHQSGTDRLNEVVTKLALADDAVVVNVQGDEPLLPAEVINQLAANLAQDHSLAAATLCEPIKSAEDAFNPNVVKVVSDKNSKALYFSRATIPWDRDHFAQGTQSLAAEYPVFRHLGLYAYRVSTLKQFARWPMSALEKIEKLEQLRLLENGFSIHVEPACMAVPGGVDTPEDLQRISTYIQSLESNHS